MRNEKITKITETALFIALVFLGVFLFKFPLPFGYMHLGDCMIFLAVLILGGKRAALAGGIGAALADVVSGYTIWALPTFACKAALALVMGLILSHKVFGLSGKAAWLVGGIAGGIVQSIGYLIFWFVLFGKAAMIAALVPLLAQTGLGIAIAFLLAAALEKTALRKYFREAVQ
ncbi:MAG: ECF transporter S component [Firmicutes bacterium]|nr:ECF transporter S component [Bacillota bacterium]